MSKRCGRGGNNHQQLILGCAKSKKNHWSVAQKWKWSFFEDTKFDRRIERNGKGHNNRICDWPFRRDETAGYENSTNATCRKPCAQWQEIKDSLVSKKKRPKVMECCSKLALGWFWKNFKSPNGEDVLDGTATTTKDKIWHPSVCRGETAIMLIFKQTYWTECRRRAPKCSTIIIL